jgi:hypothetical protein
MPGVTLRFTIHLRGQPYVLTVTPEGFVLKGRRRRVQLPWKAFLDDDAFLYSELYKSIERLRARNGSKH